MKFGSLFSGVGGFDLGFERAGMACAWQCEIDTAASSVLGHHWPGVKRYTDVRDIGASTAEPVDLICGGFPCQDVSVAGKRAGLDGNRSGLWFEFHRILSELTPEWVVVENVPGLLSSNGGRDFAVILRGLVELGYGVAWRVLDAQYFGVAQRRRRVFIVGHLGDGRAAEILFEREGGDRDTPPRRETGTRVAGTLESGANRTGGTRPPGSTVDNAPDLVVAATLNSGGNSGGFRTEPGEHLVAGTLPADYYKQGGNGMGEMQGGLVARSLTSRQSRLDGDADNFVAHTLRGEGHDASEDGTGRGTPLVFESRYARNGRGAPSELVPPLKAQSGETGKGDAAPVVFQPRYYSDRVRMGGQPSEAVTGALSADAGEGDSSPHVANVAGVRRLMPVECERLQGFPDHWTAEGVNGPQADSARYKQMGNAVAVPCAEWFGRRIAENKEPA